MGIILDTDVLVDIKRGFPNATRWLDEAATAEYRIRGITAMEIIAGSRDRNELRVNQRFLTQFEIIWPEKVDFQNAFELLMDVHLSQGTGIADCVIAAIAIREGCTVYTFNEKHLGSIPAVNHHQPYSR